MNHSGHARIHSAAAHFRLHADDDRAVVLVRIRPTGRRQAHRSSRGPRGSSRLSPAADAASGEAVQRDFLRSARRGEIEVRRSGACDVEDARHGSARDHPRVWDWLSIHRRVFVRGNARIAIRARVTKAR